MKPFRLFKTKQVRDASETKGYYGGDNNNVRNEYFKQLYGSIQGHLSLPDWGTSAEREALYKLYADKDKANHVVYSVVSDLAETVAAVMRYAEITDSDKRVIENHWAERLLKNPNDAQTMADFVELWMINLLTVGDAFVYGLESAFKHEGRKYSSLYVMPSYKVEIISGGTFAPIKGYRIQGAKVYESKELSLDATNVWFCKMPNPSGETLYGLSPLVPLLKDIEIIENGKKRANGAIKNGGVGNVVFPQLDATGIGLTEQQKNEFEKELNGHRRGNYNKVINTPIGVAKLGDTPADLSLIEAIDKSIQATCNAYHYPVDLFFGRSTFSNMAEAKKMRYELAIPYANKFLEKLGKWLGLADENLTWQVNVDQIEELKPDPNQVITSMNNAGTTINERRAYLGYEKLTEKIYDKVTYPMSLSFGDEGDEMSKPLTEISNNQNPKQ